MHILAQSYTTTRFYSHVQLANVPTILTSAYTVPVRNLTIRSMGHTSEFRRLPPDVSMIFYRDGAIYFVVSTLACIPVAC